jgi:hypothetical protein
VKQIDGPQDSRPGPGGGAAGPGPDAGTGGRLLIIEEDAATGRMVERVATELGFEVLGTGNPDSSMKIAGAWQPSAVVVGVGGVGGPGTDGIEALGRLAAAKCTAPIVLLGGIDRRKVEAARLFGAQRGLRIEAILEKPIGLHGLRDRLARLKPSAKPDLSTDLAAALPAGHLFLEYQPTYAVAGPAGGRTVGAEALVRWRHPVHGVIQPAEFLGLAEGAELIRLVTDWVFARAVEQAAAWRRDGIGLEVAVNITVPDLRNTRLPERLEELCRDAGVAPGSVVLELAEAGAMRYGAEVAAVLDRLRAKGFQLALDNFGSGWFSLVPQARPQPGHRLGRGCRFEGGRRDHRRPGDKARAEERRAGRRGPGDARLSRRDRLRPGAGQPYEPCRRSGADRRAGPPAIRACGSPAVPSGGSQLHVFEIAGFVVDAGARRRDPGGEFAGFVDRVHQAGDIGIVVGRGQELAAAALPLFR